MRSFISAALLCAVASTGCAHFRDRENKAHDEKTANKSEEANKDAKKDEKQASRKPTSKKKSETVKSEHAHTYSPDEDKPESEADKVAKAKDHDAGEEKGWRREVKEDLLSVRVHAAVIDALKLSATSVHADVEGNEVTLSGTVKNDKERKAVIKSVDDVGGVFKVKDELTIDSDGDGEADEKK